MSDAHRINRIVRAALSEPWFIQPNKFEAVVELLARRGSGERLSAEEIAEITATHQASERSQDERAIAVLSVVGIVAHRMSMVNNISGPGGTSIEGLRQEFRAAMAHPDVSTIVLDVDSPGGTVSLVSELATEIREASGKRVIAVANDLMASAAYYIASAADEIVITPSGLVGSIGVMAAHTDFSQFDENKGVVTTLISAGEGKTDGNEFEPLSDRALADMRGRVEAFYTAFVNDVVAGRNQASEVADGRSRQGKQRITGSTVRDVWQARILTASEAVEVGMADRVASLDETLERFGAAPRLAGSQAKARRLKAVAGQRSRLAARALVGAA